MFRGQCLPIEVLHRTNSWIPNAADQTPPGTTTLVAQRTKLGLVIGRATINGRPVAYTRLRSTYFHEVDSAGAFSDFNNPDKIHNARDFQRAAYQIGYTFNWFYIDNRDIAYFNSGNNPVRARNTWPQLPMRARFEWRGYDPDLHTATYTPFSQHPRVINQTYLTSWNNKQAPGFAGSPTNIFGSVYRSQPLDDRIRRGIRGRRKMTLTGLVSAMEDAGTVDLRGDKVLPYALRILGRQRDPRLATAIAKLRAWQRSGAHRIDRNRDGTYDQSDAIAIMDAWWPRMLELEFEPTLGQPLFKALEERVKFDNSPNNNGDHLGSAYQDGWYSYAQKDLRRVLRLRVRGRFHRTFCGGGSLRRCRTALATSLRAALDEGRSVLYDDSACASAHMNGNQWCYDAVRFRPLGAITQPLIHWINRPTYQQANEIQGHRPR
jgi:acyl-homoserine lactone acylase PvdQ